jgi:pantoate--beta-alanine ligase
VSAARHATTTVVRTVAETRAAVAASERPVGLVPTMGALHDGHLALIAAAARECATVVVSIFVNPTQFGAGDDLARYPRDEARDVALAAGAGATFVFAPAVADMYLPGAAASVHVAGPPAVGYEAAQRPGHFDGVATIVAKLFTIVAPERAYFGRKDAQQLAVVRRLVADLDLPVEIVAVDTAREPDGLARSSRNVYLSAAQRADAAGLHRALVAGRAAAADGAGAVVAAVTAELQTAGLAIDYVAVVDPDSFAPTSDALRPNDLIVAAVRLGETRLLDNIAIGAAVPAVTTATTAAAAANTTSPEPDPRRGPASHDKERQRGDSHGQ